MSGVRPKGYMAPNFKPVTLELIGQAKSVLEEYRDFLPMTARQIFYRMVGQYDYDKTEQAYARLCEALVKGRRAQMIPFSSIRDDGTVEHPTGGYDDVAEWWEGELSAAKGYGRDRSEGQRYRIELWCEAAGMAPQLARAVRGLGVDVYSTGGFSSVTVTHEIAMRVQRALRPTVFLHVGDYDPSGESIFESMTADVTAFVAGHRAGSMAKAREWFVPERVALTREHVLEYNLPTAPPKRTDSRSAAWAGETCQAEAMDPETLAHVVREAAVAHMDLGQWRAVVADEEREREELVADVEQMLEDRRNG